MRAAKEHKCGDCGRKIDKGETYVYGCWVDRNYISQTKQCAHCDAASGWLNSICNGFIYDQVIEELREHWEEEYDLRSFALARLILLGESQWHRDHGGINLRVSVEYVSQLARVGAAKAKKAMQPA